MQIGDLPNDLILVIGEYLRPQDLYCCNSIYFTKYWVQNKPPRLHQATYIRFLLRNDMHYVFGSLIRSNLSIFMRPGAYMYEKKKYRRFAEFMEQYCIRNQSQGCRQIIRDVK
jgi:hypothetical protein